MTVALRELKHRYAGCEVRRMPHNNPGFDVRVDEPSGETYIEVKGTTRNHPHFFMSEGERQFSHDHGDRYHLMVVYDLDLATTRGEIHFHHGPVDDPGVYLSPIQWEGSCLQ